MPVPSSISDLSTTAGSNSPAGTDPIGTDADNYLRAHASFIAQLHSVVGRTTPMTASRALVTDASAAVSVSAVTSTELGYMSGVTSAIQTQLNARLPLTGGTLTGSLAINGTTYSGTESANSGGFFTYDRDGGGSYFGLFMQSGVGHLYHSIGGDVVQFNGSGQVALNQLTANRALIADSNKTLTSSATTATELGYLSGVTSAVQTQLNGKKANFTVTVSTSAASGGSDGDMWFRY